MVMMNYVVLQEDVPTRLHLTDHYWVDRMIWDKVMEKEKPIRSLMFAVDREGGQVVMKSFSVLSNRLAEQLSPYLHNSRHRDFDFIITMRGTGFGTRYEVEAIPLGEGSLY